MPMTAEEFDDYLARRYQEQVDWYDAKAGKNKRLYLVFQWGNVVLAVVTPVLVVSLPESLKWITAATAVLLGIGTAGLKTFKFQENWILYRTIAETLKKERHLYAARVDGYGRAHVPERLFVERVEAIISREHSLWISTHQPREDDEGEGAEPPRSSAAAG